MITDDWPCQGDMDCHCHGDPSSMNPDCVRKEERVSPRMVRRDKGERYGHAQLSGQELYDHENPAPLEDPHEF